MTDLRDPVSSTSHLLTALWAVYATLVMLRLTARRPERMGPLLVYGVSMVLLFLASGTYHGLHYSSPEERRFYQKLDMSAVYLLIAGTYTPVLAIVLSGAWRKWFLRMVWLMAAAGIGCLWLLPKVPHAAMVGFYLGLGWLGILPLPLYYRAVGWRAMNWVWVGAGFYSLGAICELTEWPVIIPGYVQWHEVLHFCDTAGSVTFFLFVVRYVIPFRPPAAQPQPAPAPSPRERLVKSPESASPRAYNSLFHREGSGTHGQPLSDR